MTSKDVNNKILEIGVDHREIRSKVLTCLKTKNIKVNIISDQITDYVINKHCGVERKTINDFLMSIIDKRIFNQVNTLCKNFYNPLIIVEGGGLYRSKIKINHNVIRGVMIWISAHKRVPIIRTFNHEDTAEILFLLARSKQTKTSNYISLQYKKKPRSIQKQELYILESIDGIGYKLANILLRQFKSISEIIKADKEALNKIPGIGKQKAKYIKTILNSSQTK